MHEPNIFGTIVAQTQKLWIKTGYFDLTSAYRPDGMRRRAIDPIQRLGH